jgi:hypothetical protein
MLTREQKIEALDWLAADSIGAIIPVFIREQRAKLACRWVSPFKGLRLYQNPEGETLGYVKVHRTSGDCAGYVLDEWCRADTIDETKKWVEDNV